jgi:hypothetical protein
MVQLLLRDENFHQTCELLYSHFRDLLRGNLTQKFTLDSAIRKIREKEKKSLIELRKNFDLLREKGLTEESLLQVLEELRKFSILLGENEVNEILKNKVNEYIIENLGEENKLKHEVGDIIKDVLNTLSVYSSYIYYKNEIESLTKKINEFKKAGKIRDVKKIFNNLVNLKFFRQILDYFNSIEFMHFIYWMEESQDPSRLIIYDLINLLGLNPINTMDLIKCLDFLIKNNYLDMDHVIRYYRDSKKQNFFLVLMFLITHLNRRGLNLGEAINEIGFYRWKELLESLSIELLGCFIIPLSLRRATNMRLALGLATSFIGEIRRRGATYLEDFCRGLLNIQKYCTDKQVKRILSYAYFYGDIDIIIKLGNLAEAEGSLKKALNLLRSRI